MSDVFALDTAGRRALEQQAEENGVTLADQPPGAFDRVGAGIGQGVMRGLARTAQSAGVLAGAPIGAAADFAGTLMGDRTMGERVLDGYFGAVDRYATNAVDYWTPSAHEVGKVGQVLGGLSEIVGQLALGAGNPIPLIASAEVGGAVDLVGAGVDSTTALEVGGIQGVATAVGFRLPFLGKSLASRMASGAGGNVATGAGAAKASRLAMQAGGYSGDQFDPLDPTARAVDVLTGLAFGGLAHYQAPKTGGPGSTGGPGPGKGPPRDLTENERSAILAAADARHYQESTAPGFAADVASHVAHVEALDAATEQLARGEPVVLPEAIADASFVPRPVGEAIELPAELVALDAAQQEAGAGQPARPAVAEDPAAVLSREIDAAPVPDATRAQMREMYAAAQRVKPTFDALVRDIVRDVGTSIEPMLAKLKGVVRAAEKTMTDYAGDATKLKDLVRATIVVENGQQLRRAIEAINQRFGAPSKFRNTLDASVESRDGYRDVLANVTVDGHTTEVQVNFPEMLEAKSKNHPLYEKRRTIQGKADEERRPLTWEEAAQVAALDEKMHAAYAVAWAASLRRLNADSGISRPSSAQALSENQRPSGTSQAFTGTDPSGLGTAETGTPPTSQKMGSLPNTGGFSTTDSVAPAGQNQATVITSSGRRITVQQKIVEADQLVTSDNPEYPQELQPRQRGARKALSQQVMSIAQSLEPQLLGPSALADTGAPITGPDNIVESGNGRVMALREVFAHEPGREAAYRQYLQALGFDLSGFKHPVLVRERITELSPEDRRAFTVEANTGSTARLSPVEQAQADARLLDDSMLSQLHGGEIGSMANAGFVRAFVGHLTTGERNSMLNPDGTIGQEGVRRIQAAVLARAYGGLPESNAVLGRMLESTDADMRSTLGAILDSAPAFARLRQEIADGKVAADYDVSRFLTQAIELVGKMRATGQSLSEFLSQVDMLNPRAPIVDALMRAMYDRNGKRLASRDRVAAALESYANQAMRQLLHQGTLFAEPPIPPSQLLSAIGDQLPDAPPPEMGDMFGLRTRQGDGAAKADPIVDAARAAVDATPGLYVAVGEPAADGSVQRQTASEVMAQADAEVAKANADAKAFDAAITCYLTTGDE